MVVALLAACRGDDGPEDALAVAVEGVDVLADAVVAIAVTGAPPGEQVEIAVASTDAAGTDWSSTTRVRADAAGRVALDDAPMEPFTVLTPVDDSPDRAYAWGLDARTFVVTARAEGRQPDRVEVRRRLVAAGVTTEATTLADDGVLGDLWSPAPGTAVGSAVLVIGGSEGGRGLPTIPAALASHGVTALTVAYFAAPGLPAALAEIPLETFTAALDRLRAAPDVDPERVWVLGASRGSEAAVLVAARHPDRVAGVVATVPGSVVGCSVADRDRAAWTEGGVPIPCLPVTPLPITDVDGPVIATCGGDDRLWPSCAQAEDLFDRLAATDRPPGDHLVSDPAAGHWVGTPVPYVAARSTVSTGLPEVGGDVLADDRVRAEAWPLVLEALGAAP